MAMGSFTLSLERFGRLSIRQAELVSQKIAFEAFKRIVYRTPVDTGRLRANWGVQIGSPYTGYNEAATDTGGGATVARASAAVQGWNARQPIFLCNNVVYAIPIEYGHSRIKSPQGMVRVTIAEMQNGGAEAAAR
jgi:hypothetical protein